MSKSINEIIICKRWYVQALNVTHTVNKSVVITLQPNTCESLEMTVAWKNVVSWWLPILNTTPNILSLGVKAV